MRWLFFGLLCLSCKHYDDRQVAAKQGIRISACAAYLYEPDRTGAVVIDGAGRSGTIVEHGGARYAIHRDDCLVVERPTIHWHVVGDAAFVGLGDSDRVTERSTKRLSQYDALYANDDLLSVALYQTVMGNVLWIGNGDRSAQRRLFERLTGTTPPR